MIVLVCGGRDYTGDLSCLDQLDITLLVHGGARGADVRAGSYAESKGIHTCVVRALWGQPVDRSAGHKRNAAMLLLPVQYCVAFPGGRGTADMVKKCEAKGIPVWRPYG